MRDPRNPFLLRKSEAIDSDSAFLNLFEPGMLDILPEENCFRNVRTIRSAAGGGKTSLLRLFTPEVLKHIHDHRTDASIKELFDRLVQLGAIDHKSGPSVLGVMLICGRNYSHLQHLGVDQTHRDRLFFGLLNVRIALAMLRSAMAFSRLNYPQDLGRLQIGALPESKRIPGLSLPCDGHRLKIWAAKTEEQICEALDSFRHIEDEQIPGHESIFSLWLIQPELLTIDGQPLVDQTLVMMDDIHQLSSSQRDTLIETVIELRTPVGIWIAERFEALSTEEMLASGSIEGRDHERAVEIEQYWREHFGKFEKHCRRIADRRVQWARSASMATYKDCVASSLDSAVYDRKLREALDIVESRVRTFAQGGSKFTGWIENIRRETGTPHELATKWKALEILIERERRKKQRLLFDNPLSDVELEKKSDSSLHKAAELFLANEFDVPYYFGIERLSRLASLNVEQFIGLSGEVFWEVESRSIRTNREPLPPGRQHAIMREESEAIWKDIPVRVRDGRALKNLLEGIAEFSRWYTYRPSAPNDPGVSGTAILMSDREKLLDPKFLTVRPEYRRLADLLASALAHNLLVAQLDYNCKGDRWMVLNLNRILCVRFGLPLNYGLYKERPLKTLLSWIDSRFVAPANEEMLL